MKYKQAQKQNQRIQSISDQDLIVGVDIAKETHVSRAIDLRGIEPTGHYWFAMAEYLLKVGVKLVIVNPHHVNKSKELEDNSQTKNDYKLSIADLCDKGLKTLVPLSFHMTHILRLA